MSLNTIIVEDEPLSRTFLKNLLNEFCPEINIVGSAGSEDEAVAMISELRPDLVFLDIELQQGTGFGVLQRINFPELHIVFTTAYDHRSINAIKFSRAGYLSKPIDIEDLQETIKLICEKAKTTAQQAAIHHLIETLENNNIPVHIGLNTLDGTEYARISDILYLESGMNEVIFYLTTGNIYTSGSLKDFEQLLTNHGFYRTHLSYIVNLKAIDKIVDEQVMMKNGSPVPLSARKKEELIALLEK